MKLRNGGMMRRALALVVVLAATLWLAQPALPSAKLAPNTQSNVMAGLDYNGYIGVPGAVSAIIVVPKLACTGAPPAGTSIYAGVGIQSVNSYARLDISCTAQGVARYYPSLMVNGTVKDMPGDAAHAGDTIQFAVSQSDSQATVSVIDVTHKFNATSNGTGSGTGQGIVAGDFPVVSGSTTSGVPNFGTLAFSTALINGYPFGAAGTGLQANDLSTSSTGPQIKTTYSTANKEAFATVFKHS